MAPENPERIVTAASEAGRGASGETPPLSAPARVAAIGSALRRMARLRYGSGGPSSRSRSVESTAIELDDEAVEAARIAVEDLLVEFRDSRIGILGRGNGFVIREKDGSDSTVMRLGTPEGLRVGIKAYLAAVEAKRG